MPDFGGSTLVEAMESTAAAAHPAAQPSAPAKSAWGKQPASAPRAKSLAEIIEEEQTERARQSMSAKAAMKAQAEPVDDELELALKLSLTESGGRPHFDPVDADYELALELQAEWDAAASDTSETGSVIVHDLGEEVEAEDKAVRAAAKATEDDFLVALRLQAEYDDEVTRFEARFTGNERVRVSARRLNESLSDVHQMLAEAEEARRLEEAAFLEEAGLDPNEVSDQELSSDDADGFDGDDVPLAVARHFKKEIITKHDIPITTRRNAKKLEDLDMSSGNTVDEKQLRVSNRVFNTLREHSRKSAPKTARVHGKEDFATHERVLDPRTKLLLFRMLNTGELERIDGIISTGKESNVYGAMAGVDFSEELDGSDIREVPAVIKVFKTTLDDFRNRYEYIREDPRFANRLSRHNVGKLIKLWAEKEMYNLHRMHRADIPCPAVLSYRKHILVLSLIGDADGSPAPKLRDAADRLSAAALARHYRECLLLVRRLYQRAGLVHADLSEYNILLHEHALHLIDVSQAVDVTHPRALIFLHRDLSIIGKFFLARGVDSVLAPLEAVAFVTRKRDDGGDVDDESDLYDAIVAEARQMVSSSAKAVSFAAREAAAEGTSSATADELSRIMEELLPNCWPHGLTKKHYKQGAVLPPEESHEEEEEA